MAACRCPLWAERWDTVRFRAVRGPARRARRGAVLVRDAAGCRRQAESSSGRWLTLEAGVSSRSKSPARAPISCHRDDEGGRAPVNTRNRAITPDGRGNGHAESSCALRHDGSAHIRRARPRANIRSASATSARGGTGSVLSVQARLPREHVTIAGQSTTGTFPSDERGAGHVSLLRQRGGHVSLLPECGSTVYWDISVAPDVVGVAIGEFTDPTFPRPMISGFVAYAAPWAMKPSDLVRARDSRLTTETSHGRPRA